MKRVHNNDGFSYANKRRSAVAEEEEARKSITAKTLSYLQELNIRFQDQGQPEVCRSFLQIMINFRAKKIDASTVVRKLEVLLKGHEDLIAKFKTFLNCKEEEEDEVEKPKSEVGYTVKQSGFKQRSHYEALMSISEEYRQQLDTLLGSLAAAAQLVDEFLYSVDENHFLKNRYFESFPGKSGLDVRDLFHENPISALLTQVKQKKEELFKFRSYCNKVWDYHQLNG